MRTIGKKFGANRDITVMNQIIVLKYSPRQLLRKMISVQQYKSTK